MNRRFIHSRLSGLSRYLILLVAGLMLLGGWITPAPDSWGLEERLDWGACDYEKFSPDDIDWSHYFSADKGVENDSSGTPADSGNVVFFWRDRTANSNDCYQGTNANRPIFKTGVHNGNNGLYFVTDDFMTASGDTPRGERTYFFVLSSNKTSANHIIGHSTITTRKGVVTFNLQNNMPRWGGGDGYIYFSDNPKQDDSKVHVVMVYAHPTSIADCEMWFDGTKLTTYTSSGALDKVWEDLLLGRATTFGKFTISEFGVYRGDLRGALQTKYQNWAINKYGITP